MREPTMDRLTADNAALKVKLVNMQNERNAWMEEASALNSRLVNLENQIGSQRNDTELAHLRLVAVAAETFLGFLDDDSLIDQRTDARLRQSREFAESQIRGAIERLKNK